MKRLVRIAAVQLRSVPDVQTNTAKVLSAIAEGKRQGAHVVALPENSIFLSVAKSGDLAPIVTVGPGSEQADPLLREVCEKAQRENVAVLLPLLEKDQDGKVYNTCLWIDDDGVVRYRYRKIHLFDYGPLAESKTITGGDRLCSFRSGTTPSFLAALTICFDLRFPHVFEQYAEMGSEVIFVPSAFTLETGKAHWLALLRARAIEGQCYVVAPAQWGVHSETRASHGETCIIDPWGTVIAMASNQECVISADLDLDYLASIRERMPINQMRKKHILKDST
jgi:deaminated glutathione amidase